MEETAYDEVGHILITGAVGLDLRQKGIVIYEFEDVGEVGRSTGKLASGGLAT